MKISLWSGPRTCSTALMYSFGARPDVAVVDEPLFGHYLLESGAHRPSRKEVLEGMELDAFALIQAMNRPALQAGEHVFFKHMACHLRGFAPEVFAEHTHVLLVRHPARVLSSYTAHIEAPSLEDLGYDWQVDWLNQCKRNDWPVVVVDSDALVAAPAAGLEALCAFLGLPWTEAMLSWPAGGRQEDGVWAKYWYHAVHRSTGWVEKPEMAELPAVADELRDVFDICLPLYRSLVAHSIV